MDLTWRSQAQTWVGCVPSSGHTLPEPVCVKSLDCFTPNAWDTSWEESSEMLEVCAYRNTQNCRKICG